MISLNTLNQINDIVTVLNNTKKAIQKPQSDGSFAQTLQQIQVQTPAQTVQQTTVSPSKPQEHSMFSDTCCVDGCNNSAVLWIKGKPYCKEHDPDNRVDTEEE